MGDIVNGELGEQISHEMGQFWVIKFFVQYFSLLSVTIFTFLVIQEHFRNSPGKLISSKVNPSVS